MTDIGFPIAPFLDKSHVSENSGRNNVQNIVCAVDNLYPKSHWNVLFLSLYIEPFIPRSDSSSLWFHFTYGCEGHIYAKKFHSVHISFNLSARIFTTIIWSQTFKGLATLIFNQCPKLLELFKGLKLIDQEINPRKLIEIINKCQNIVYIYEWWFFYARKITVKKL